jgi:hypothetical protein
MSFTKIKVNPSLYYIFVGIDLFFLVLYVDELFLTGQENLTAGLESGYGS